MFCDEGLPCRSYHSQSVQTASAWPGLDWVAEPHYSRGVRGINQTVPVSRYFKVLSFACGVLNDSKRVLFAKLLARLIVGKRTRWSRLENLDS